MRVLDAREVVLLANRESMLQRRKNLVTALLIEPDFQATLDFQI
jgi:hypothetical protein